jgi:stage III sporulation protein AD
MDFVKIIGVAILTTFAVLVLKPTRPDIAAVVSVAGGLIVLLMFVDSLSIVIQNITAIVNRTGIKSGVFSALLKIIGIGYLTEFAAGICVDAGNQSMAQKVLLGGKVIILVLALPIVNNLIEIVAGLLP